MNAAQPQPYAAPPPPQKSGGALKWILLTCGCITLLAIGAVGSCVLLVGYGVSKAKEIAEAWEKAQKEGEDYIRNNKYVKERLGTVARITMSSSGGAHRPTGPEDQTGLVSYKVVGSKGEGFVDLEITIAGLKPKYTGGYLRFKGKRIDLDTGNETADDQAPTPEPPPEEDPMKKEDK